MSDTYTVRIAIWPYSTGAGQEEDQKRAGERMAIFSVIADDFEKACAAAKLIVTGIKTNPAVWMAPIFSIERAR
jgi:hypothetical protein